MEEFSADCQRRPPWLRPPRLRRPRLLLGLIGAEPACACCSCSWCTRSSCTSRVAQQHDTNMISRCRRWQSAGIPSIWQHRMPAACRDARDASRSQGVSNIPAARGTACTAAAGAASRGRPPSGYSSVSSWWRAGAGDVEGRCRRCYGVALLPQLRCTPRPSSRHFIIQGFLV